MNLLRRRFVVPGLAAILIAFAAGGTLVRAGAAAGSPAEAPAWRLRNLDGQPVSSSAYRGKVLIVDFWATWCPYCRQEIPGLEDLYRQYKSRGLVVLGVSLDQDGPSVVKAFVQKYDVTYPMVMGNDRVTQAFGGFDAIPMTFVIGRNGAIVASHEGFTARADFEKEIKPLL